MKKEWVLLSVTVLVTTAIFLSLVRWLAPQLVGLPIDMRLVQVSKTLPPFFDGVFRKEDYATQELLLKDPYTNVRFRPLLRAVSGEGPHDILGFRNLGIPNTADIITLGDSQTYGIGEPLENNWPSQLGDELVQSGQKQSTVYSMAVGGWAGVQYLDMFPKAALLNPDVVVVAFYSGNDPLESFSMAYGLPQWDSLRVDAELTNSDIPNIGPGLSIEDSWKATFKDGLESRFMPKKRLAVNDSDYPAVRAGYEIMAEVSRRIMAMAAEHEITVVFTVIPTRELVYAKKVEADKLIAPEPYQRLVLLESENIKKLASAIRASQGAIYVDLVQPMQLAAISSTPLYPRKWDGHPGAEGYTVISKVLATALEPLL